VACMPYYGCLSCSAPRGLPRQYAGCHLRLRAYASSAAAFQRPCLLPRHGHRLSLITAGSRWYAFFTPSFTARYVVASCA